ncbi:restriction endonuclease [Niallia circulans]|uniref:restriction endonuclease n=1 Tax=Niallia circulans TaxID=1397 RepID=UPI001595E3E1|nr:restriction endonuclease [Niallia circulans]
MKNKDRHTIASGIAVFSAFYLFMKKNEIKAFIPFLENSIYFLIFVVVTEIILYCLIWSIIPAKKSRKSKNVMKNSPSKKSTPVNTSKKTAPTGSNSKHSLLHSDKEILTLPFDQLTWRDFERLCYLYFKAKGYKPRETSEGADGGVDLIIYNKHHQADVAIQIKHYQKGKQITVKEIRELATAKKNHKCMLADFITTSTYTNAALVEADKFNIQCRQKEWVENKILRWRAQATKSIS